MGKLFFNEYIKGPRTLLMEKCPCRILCGKKTCRSEKILQLFPRAQNNPMRGLASTARFKGRYFSFRCCSRGRQRRSGEGGNVVHAFFRARSALAARLRLSSLPLLFFSCRGRATSLFRSFATSRTLFV